MPFTYLMFTFRKLTQRKIAVILEGLQCSQHKTIAHMLSDYQKQCSSTGDNSRQWTNIQLQNG